MKRALIDTDILSLFFREQPQAVSKFREYLKEYGRINFSIFAEYCNILPLTTQSVTIAGDKGLSHWKWRTGTGNFIELVIINKN